MKKKSKSPLDNHAHEGFTPGPWIISDKREDAGNMVKIGTGEKGWLGCAAAFGDTPEESMANARLISAAPELLERLEDILGLPCDTDGNGQCRFCGRDFEENQTLCDADDDCPGAMARAAIRKAKGGK